MTEEESEAWATFSNAGLLWWTNRILHTFGWAIVMRADSMSGRIVHVKPERVKCLGFPEASNSLRLAQFREHVKGLS